jgi:ABC-type glycerol-3-phosphate transport system substrate-binding protein
MSVKRMLSRRQFVYGLAAAGGAAGLAACAAPVAQTGESESGAPAASETVRLVIDARVGEGPYMTDTFEWFKEDHPNVEIEVREYPFAEYFTKLLALSAAQQEGDLIWGNISGGRYLSFGVKGIVIPLNDYVERDDYDFSPFFASSVESGRFEGNLYAMPLSGMPSQRPIFYNTELMDGVEFDVTKNFDWTPDDLIEVGTKLTKREGDRVVVWGFIPDRGGYFGVVPWVRTFGGDLLSEDGRTCVFNSPEVVECITFLQSLSDVHGISPKPGETTGGGSDMWLGRSAAMFQTSTGALTSLREAADFEYGASVMVRHPVHGRSDMDATYHLGIAARSKAQDIAWELAKHYCTREVGIYKLHTPAGMPAAREDVYNSEEAIALHPGFPLLGQAGEWSKPHIVPWNLRGAEVIDAVENNMERIYLGELTVEQGVELIQQEVQTVLDKPMA